MYHIAQATPRGPEGIKSLTNRAGAVLNNGDPSQGNFFVVLGQLIGALTSVMGVILLGFIIVAGFYWMTAGGDENQVAKAKRLLVNSTIGIVLVLVSYAIAQFAQEALIDRLTGSTPAPVEDAAPAP